MMYRKLLFFRVRRASLNWQGSGLEIHRAARPLGVRIPRPPPLLKHLHRTQFPEQVVNGAPLGHFLAMSAFCDPREGLRSCTARLRPLKPLGQNGGPTWP